MQQEIEDRIVTWNQADIKNKVKLQECFNQLNYLLKHERVPLREDSIRWIENTRETREQSLVLEQKRKQLEFEVSISELFKPIMDQAYPYFLVPSKKAIDFSCSGVVITNGEIYVFRPLPAHTIHVETQDNQLVLTCEEQQVEVEPLQTLGFSYWHKGFRIKNQVKDFGVEPIGQSVQFLLELQQSLGLVPKPVSEIFIAPFPMLKVEGVGSYSTILSLSHVYDIIAKLRMEQGVLSKESIGLRDYLRRPPEPIPPPGLFKKIMRFIQKVIQ